MGQKSVRVVSYYGNKYKVAYLIGATLDEVQEALSAKFCERFSYKRPKKVREPKTQKAQPNIQAVKAKATFGAVAA